MFLPKTYLYFGNAGNKFICKSVWTQIKMSLLRKVFLHPYPRKEIFLIQWFSGELYYAVRNKLSIP